MRATEPLLSALRERLAPGDANPPAPPNDIARAESQLGFRLPPLLRQLYGDANGGIGPAYPADRAAVDRLFDTLSEDRLASLDRLDRQAWHLDTYPRLVASMREHEGDLLRPERGLVLVRDAP